jgi:hypothetical protein
MYFKRHFQCFISLKTCSRAGEEEGKTVVNFYNILQTAFAQIIFQLNCKIKDAQNILVRKSCLLNVGEIDIPIFNFNNMLCALFLYESKLSSFSLVTFGFVIFGV